MIRKPLLLLLLVTALLLPSLSLGAQPAKGEPVGEVRVRGNLRVETEKILTVVKTKPGDPFDPELVREDIAAIYAMGYFDDALVEYDEEGRITFVVLERPALRRWSIEKNEEVEQSDADEVVLLKPLEILRLGEAEKAAEAIKELFIKDSFYLATVEPELIPVEGSKNQVDLFFHVDPRDKVRVRRIQLAGATDDDTDQIRSGMVMSEYSSWSWLTDSGTFNRAELSRDLEWVRYWYMNNGHADVDVGEPLVQVTRDLKYVEVSIPVDPGPVYYYDKIEFSGDSHYPVEKLAEVADINTGDKFSSDTLRRALIAVEDLHADEGYAYARAIPRYRTNPETEKIDLNIEVQKGEIYHIGRIEARGNTKTRDRVIRRDVKPYEGQLYKRSRLRRSERDLNRLGFFETVNITQTRREEEKVVDLDIEVAEKLTGSFSAGVGYSSADGVMLMGSVSQSNLFGYGYQLSGDVGFSATSRSYSITFNNPRLFDSDVFFGFDIYNTLKEYNEYDRDSLGGRLKLGKTFLDDWHVRVTYGWDSSQVKGVCTFEEFNAGLCDEPASLIVQEQEGTTVTSSITPQLSYDSRDSQLDPLEGHLSKFSIEWAGGILGGDAEYIKYNVDSRQHFPILPNTTFMIRGRAGYVQGLGGKDVPLYERFALGGISTLRGFDTRSVGPVDPGEIDPETGAVIRPSSGEVIGGDKWVAVNAEVVFPLILEAKLKGVVFYDAGNAWDEEDGWFESSMRDSAGAGVRWFSPLGPLRLEYGKNLHPKEGEADSQWEFMIGGYF